MRRLIVLPKSGREEYMELADVGIRGNGHMMMLEEKAAEIAAFLADWLEKKGL